MSGTAEFSPVDQVRVPELHEDPELAAEVTCTLAIRGHANLSRETRYVRCAPDSRVTMTLRNFKTLGK